MHRRLLVVLCLLLSSSGLLADDPARLVARSGSDAQPAATIVFADDTVRITGVRPGGTVVLFGVERIVRDDFSQSVVVWDERLSDDDHDGAVSLALKHAMSPLTVLAVVDENNGHYVVATPGFIPLTIPPAGKLHGNDKGEPIEFQNGMPYAEALVLRPGKGAWVAHGFDGTASDSDGRADGKIGIRFDAMKPIHGRPETTAPDRLLPQDLLIVINPRSLAVYADDVKEKN